MENLVGINPLAFFSILGGIAVLTSAAVSVTRRVPFPVWAALLVAGGALLIYAGQAARV